MGILGTEGSWKDGVTIPNNPPDPPKPTPPATETPPNTDSQAQQDWKAYNDYGTGDVTATDQQNKPTTNPKYADEGYQTETDSKPVTSKPATESSLDDVPAAAKAEKKATNAVAAKPASTATGKTPDLNKGAGSSSGNLKFPSVDRIMGLPPKWAATDADGQMESLMDCSFPILQIRPLELKSQSSSSDRNTKTSAIVDAFYKFAIQADGSLGYSHTNDYAEAGITNMLKQLIPSDTMREVRQLGKVMKGPLGPAMGKAASETTGVMTKGLSDALSSSLQKGMQAVNGGELGGVGSYMHAIGSDVISGLLEGARIDLPNIWVDSKTAMSWNFNIKLRTFGTNQSDPEYIKEIVEPLLVLLMLALPVSGKSFAYTEPPYVEIKVGSLIHCKLGGITSISWNSSLNEWNFNQMPRQLDVSLTVTDLYNVMVQTEDGGDHANKDLPTLKKIIDKLKEKTAVVSVPGTPKNILLNEYFSQGREIGDDKNIDSVASLEQADSLNKSISKSVKGVDASGISAVIKSGNVSGAFGSLPGGLAQNVTASFNPTSSSLSFLSGGLNGAMLGSIPNISQLTGGLNVSSLLSGNALNLNMLSSAINLNALTSIGSNFAGNLSSAFSGSLSSIFNSANMQTLTGGLTSVVPSNFLSAISQATTSLGAFIPTELSGGASIGNLAKIMSQSLTAVPAMVSSVANGLSTSLSSDRLMESIMSNIKATDSNLDIGIRLSDYQQNVLKNYTGNLVTELNKVDFVSEANNIKADIAMRNPLEQLNTAMTTVYENVGNTIATAAGLSFNNAALQGTTSGSVDCSVSINDKN